jgi:hypothetical protein
MRAALTLALLAAAAPALAGAPLALAERQVVSLEFQQPVIRVTTTDPDLLQVQIAGPKVTVAAVRGGRAALEIAFGDGATVTYDVSVEAVRRPAARAPGAAPGPNELVLAPGEERRFRAPGVARVLLEENGVARVSVQGETVSVAALGRGDASLVVVDGAGTRTPWQIRVR